MFSRFGPWEIVLILVIVLIIFGVGKLPQVGNAIGKGIRAFKRGQSGEEDEGNEEAEKKKMVAARRKKPAARKSAKS
jgi:sec-independent protein translocase protein TatA